MLYRCHNPKYPNFYNYGGRGIIVCDRWRYSFETFVADMGPRPSLDFWIDRIHVNGNYEPGNCRWLEKKKNAGGRRRARHHINGNKHIDAMVSLLSAPG